MKNLLTVIVITIFNIACAAKADDSILIQNDICSGVRTTEILEALTLKCDGDFTLSGGTITTDKKLIIISSGSITLDNILIFANEIELHSPDGITMGEQALLSATGSVTYIIVGRGNLTIAGGGATITEGVTVLSSHGTMITEGSIALATNGFAITPSTTITTEGTIGQLPNNEFVPTPSSTITTEGTLSQSSNGITKTESVTVPISDNSSYTATSEASLTPSSKQASTNSGAGIITAWNFIFFIIFLSIYNLYAEHEKYFSRRNSTE